VFPDDQFSACIAELFFLLLSFNMIIIILQTLRLWNMEAWIT